MAILACLFPIRISLKARKGGRLKRSRAPLAIEVYAPFASSDEAGYHAEDHHALSVDCQFAIAFWLKASVLEIALLSFLVASS